MRSCNTEENTCPQSTACVEFAENRPGVFNGTCECRDPITHFNPKYKNDADYCITNTSNSPKNHTDSLEDETSAQKQKFKSPSKTHHFVAGVIFPIAFVLIVLATIFVYKKFHVTQRIRNIRRSRRPFYEDVMLGANDIDDPPLI